MPISPYSLIAAVVTAGGTGYSSGDVLTMADGGVGVHSVAAQVTVTGVSGGVVSAVSALTLGSYSALPDSPVSVTGGGGSGCTLTPMWATLYALPVDLHVRYDWREIGDLISDSNEQISVVDQITVGTTPNGLLLQILSDAGGDVEAALLASGRYENTDLFDLAGNSASLLKRIICEIAIAYIYERKPFYKSERTEQYSKAKEGHLKRLADGVNVFNLPLLIEAGMPDVTGPSTIDYQNLNLTTDRCTNYYPRRALPFSR